MEKDSFEELLRRKVLQAESALDLDSNKEKVWNSIQKKQQPKRKFYYAAAAILLMIGLGSVFYLKKDEAITIAKKIDVEKPVVASLKKPLIVAPAKRIIEKTPAKRVESEQVELPISPVVVQNVEPLIPVQPVENNIVAMVPKTTNTGKTGTIDASSVVPEFTVQLKRGVSIVDNTDENIIITNLKKFKLKRDTTYFANAAEKQPTPLKLTFKKEN